MRQARRLLTRGGQGGRLIARLLPRDKGHTEGVEPAVTERPVRMMVDAPGEKGRKG